MSTMNELSMILDSMIDSGNNMIKAANALKAFYTSTSAEVSEVSEEKKAETEKTYTLQEVRAILSEKSKAGFREQVKELITKHGADNLTQLDSAEYSSLIAEVEVLQNA